MLVASDAMVVRSEESTPEKPPDDSPTEKMASTSTELGNSSATSSPLNLTLRLAEASDLKRQFHHFATNPPSTGSTSTPVTNPSHPPRSPSYAEVVYPCKRSEDSENDKNPLSITHHDRNNVLLPPSENSNLAIHLQTCIIPSPRFHSNLCGYHLLPNDRRTFDSSTLDKSTPVCTVLDAYLDSKYMFIRDLCSRTSVVYLICVYRYHL